MNKILLPGLLLAVSLGLPAQQRVDLRTGWLLQSSKIAGSDGARLSEQLPAADLKSWHRATVPSTVVGALVDDSLFGDPFYAMNLRSIPGMTYEIGQNFVHLPMDSTSPYAVPWWYRTTFRVPAGMRNRRVTLHFDGINYRANVWLNGHRLADSSHVAGTYRRYEMDVTDSLKPSALNVLAVEVFAPDTLDLQTTWVDWSPSPPDKDMGLWQPVYLSSSGDVVVRSPEVISKVDSSQNRAELTVATDLRNLSGDTTWGTLRGHIGSIEFSRPIILAPHDSAFVRFTPDTFPQLRVDNPRLWWPAEMQKGPPALYGLELVFLTNPAGARSAALRRARPVVSDSQHLRFGIRQITSEFTATPDSAKLFRVNGRRVLIRGGGWAPDMFFRPQPQRQADQLRYAMDMHLNTIRLEGNYENDDFWQRTDSLGVLVMTGWVCCSPWEQWPKWGPEQRAIAAASLQSQIRRLRSRPSALVWLNGSDNPPPADVEQMYLGIEAQEAWPNPTISSASAKPAQFSAHSGVKMTGPYDWVPPSYWLQDKTHGGAWGYNTETSPGAAVPPMESMRRMIPAQDLVAYPPDSMWLYHAAGGQFTHLLDRFDSALTVRYGLPANATEYTVKSQLMTYEGERAMFEAYRRNGYATTGIIQWMLNNAWPSIYWHLFDWYLRPAGGYFGAKKANEPVHVMFSYDDRSIAIINATRDAIRGAHLRVRMLGLDGSAKFTSDTTLDVPADTALRTIVLPEPTDSSGTYFVDLRLTGAGRTPTSLSTNFYWLSTHPDVLADTSTWYMTPVKQYADYTSLNTMPAATVRATASVTRNGDSQRARVSVTNTGKTPAFFVRLQVIGQSGDEALPVLWDDNYVSLLPGETRTLTATYRTRDLGGSPARVILTGWNVRRTVAR
jgi:exo-1,4-beta-D-glucosaminidase